MLPIYTDPNKNLMLLQTRWKNILDPIVSDPLVNNNFLQNISILSGSNTINHMLGRALQGWFIVRQSASATFYDTQATNTTPNLTLILVSSAACTISLIVF